MAPRKQQGDDSGQDRGGRSRSNSGGSSSSSKRQLPKDGEDYKVKRERNNIAVRKSRQLSRQKAKAMEGKVNELRSENRNLEDKVKLLSKELGVLKDLFLSTATLPGQSAMGMTAEEEEVLNELESVDTDRKYSSS